MRAIILAAGIGSRLRPITNNKPKALVEVNGRPILSYLLEGLKTNNISDVVVCVGFNAAQISNYCSSHYNDLNLEFVHNQEFDVTNNMYSLYLARQYLVGDCLLMNGDLVYDQAILSKLISAPGTAVAVDTSCYYDESMKVRVKNGSIQNISKQISKDEAFGCSIDVYKFAAQDTAILRDQIVHLVERESGRTQWTEVLLDRAFSAGSINAKPLEINPMKWFEIDNFEDLSRAEALTNSKVPTLANKKIFFIDTDGTLRLKNQKIAGSSEFLEHLKNSNKLFYIISNNSSLTPQRHASYLNELGFAVDESQIWISTQSTVQYLKKRGFKKVYWVANSEVSAYLESEGLAFDADNPQAVLLTYDTELTFKKLEETCRLVAKGLPYFATHHDVVCPTPNGFVPDIGTFIKVIETTTAVTPNMIFGKPNPSLVEQLLQKNGLSWEDAVIIGDRLYTDIQMAAQTGMTSVLVLTGETTRKDYENAAVRADIVVPSLAGLRLDTILIESELNLSFPIPARSNHKVPMVRNLSNLISSVENPSKTREV